MKPGQRVIVTFPERDRLPDARAEVIGGPLMKAGSVVWKVRTISDDAVDLWVPEEWMRPLLRAVE